MNAQVPLAPLQDLSLQGSFSGHETFPFRYAWLPKGIQAIDRQPDIFTAEDAMVRLGVGKNMVRSIRHWCLATGVAAESGMLPGTRTRVLNPSKFGRQLLLCDGSTGDGWDPFLEDDGSLWVLHWHLATNTSRATSWYWAFNLCKEPEITRDTMLASLCRLAEVHNWSRISESSLKSDISCFLRTYVSGKRGPTSTAEDTLDCPLVSLRLLIDVDGERFRFNNGFKPNLNAAVFAYALLDCWESRHPGQETLSLREITHGDGSPGRIFRLDDDAVLTYLDEIGSVTQGRLEFNDTAIVRQVARRSPIAAFEVLDAYYQN